MAVVSLRHLVVSQTVMSVISEILREVAINSGGAQTCFLLESRLTCGISETSYFLHPVYNSEASGFQAVWYCQAIRLP